MKKRIMANAVFEDACDKSVALKMAFKQWSDDPDNPYGTNLNVDKVFAEFLKDWAKDLEDYNGQT